MKGTSFTSEEFYLRIFKFIILLAMTIGLLVAIGSLIYSGVQYSQSPKEPAPAKTAPAESVNLKEFIEKATPKKEDPPQKPQEEPKDEDQNKPKPAIPGKYSDQAKSIIGCANEFFKIFGDGIGDRTDRVTENFRQFLERTASRARRGDPWVTDLTKFTCEGLKNADLIALKKKYPNFDAVNDLVSFHIEKWDEIQGRIKQFNDEEQARIADEKSEEEARVMMAKAKALGALMTAAIAFGIFMALALYLIFASIESNLRNINRSIEEFGKHERTGSSTSSEPTV
jgi:hypothetical protein